MAFRSDEDAMRNQIDALKGDLEERDAEVARLREQLESERRAAASSTEPKAPPAPQGTTSFWLKARPAPAEPSPDGDTWGLSRSEPSGWTFPVLMIAWLVLFAGAGAYLHWTGQAAPEETIPLLLFSLPPIFFLVYRSGVVIDRRARTITVWQRFLVRFERTHPVEGQRIAVSSRLHSPKEGDSYWVGRVMLGKTTLLVRKQKAAMSLAERIAKFAGIPFDGELRESQRTLMRRAAMPLIATSIAAVVFVVLFLILESLKAP